MDPQHRLLLEYAELAFADAGYDRESLKGQDVGVFVGIANADAMIISETSGVNLGVYGANGTSHSTAVGRISFTFGLTYHPRAGFLSLDVVIFDKAFYVEP